jgi:hypothetical protein
MSANEEIRQYFRSINPAAQVRVNVRGEVSVKYGPTDRRGWQFMGLTNDILKLADASRAA